MKELAYRPMPIVSALPTPSAILKGVILVLSTNNKPYFCDGTQWICMVQPTTAATIGFDAGTWQAPDMNVWNSQVCEWVPPGASTTLPGVKGFPALTTAGTVTSRTFATTNALTLMRRLGFVSGTTTATVVGARNATAAMWQGSGLVGGFIFKVSFGISDAAAVATARMFVGLSTSTALLTNAEPSTYTNCIGLGHGSGQTTMRLFFGGSAAQTPVDLGANFPANTLNADAYTLVLYAPTNPSTAGFLMGYYVRREGTAFTASGKITGTAGTTLPAVATALTFNSMRTNNATALAVGIDIGPITSAMWNG